MSGPDIKENESVRSGNIISEDLLQKWMGVSQKYRGRDEVVFGMHDGVAVTLLKTGVVR